MTKFDPVHVRNTAAFRLELERSAKLADYLPNSVGSAAMLSLNRAVSLWIAGLEDEAYPIVRRARDWLEDSIGRKETYGHPPSYFLALRHRGLALAYWLTDNENRSDLFGRAVSLEEEAWPDLQADRDTIRKLYLPDWARDCFDATMFAHALDIASDFDVVPSARAEEITTELELALWACQNGDDPERLARVGSVVLTSRVESWLSDGLALLTAAWLKLVFWDSGQARTPDETLRRVYDIIQGIERPRSK